MPQINRIRVNNVKYNFGTQYYDDFMMRLSGKNTIYDLANGGGKSLLMLLLLQNMLPNCTLDEKQPIEKLFRGNTGNTAIHSLIEWKLDSCYRRDNYQYMVTGFCARRARGMAEADAQSQQASEADGNSAASAREAASIEYFNYVIFYREFGDNDIRNLPLTRNGKRITYQELKDYLREIEKQDFNISVKIFDRKGDYQNFISRYGIYESEWEIVRGINKTEGHVRTYFESNYRTSRKVIEDLLIEEIIQKSFQNRLGVNDEDDRMAKALLDIKDKLAELSRKQGVINRYDAQAEAIEGFTAGLADFKSIYEDKQARSEELLNMLYAARRQAHNCERELEQFDAAVERIQTEIEREHRLVDTAEIVMQQASFDSVGALVAESAARRDALVRDSESLRKELTMRECLADYKEYTEYGKQLEEIRQIMDNRLREHGDITQELRSLAAVRRLQDIREQQKLTARLSEAKSLADNEMKALEAYRSQKQEAANDICIIQGRKEILQKQLEACEIELGKKLTSASVLISEDAEKELKEADERIEAVNKRLAAAQKEAGTAAEQLAACHDECRDTQTQLSYSKRTLEDIRAQLAQMESDSEQLANLKKVYGQESIQGLVEVTRANSRRLESQIEELNNRIYKTEAYIENIQKGLYDCDGEQYSKVYEYLVAGYGDDVMTGAKWYASLNPGQKRDISKRVPFIHYGFVIKNDFERIKADEGLQRFYGSSYAVPVISENVLYDMKLEVNTELVAFAFRDVSFMTDAGRVETEIRRCREEIAEWELQLDRLKDRNQVIAEDYNKALKAWVGQSVNVVSEDTLADRIKECEQLEQKYNRLKSQEQELTAVKENRDNGLAQATDELSAAQEHYELIQNIRNLNIKIDEYRTTIEDYRLKEQEKKAVADRMDESIQPCSERLDTYRSTVAAITGKQEHIEAEWNIFAAYYNEQDAADIGVQNIDAQAYGRDDLESRFMALKTIIENDTRDITDKEKLRNHLAASMDKCKKAIEYRGLTLDIVMKHAEENPDISNDAPARLELKERLAEYDRQLKTVEESLDSQNALYNRLDGSISHGIHQIEEKYGTFEKIECANPEAYKEQHQKLISRLTDNRKRLLHRQKELQNGQSNVLLIIKDMERMLRGFGMADKLQQEEDVADSTVDYKNYESVQRDIEQLAKRESRRRDAFIKQKSELAEKLKRLDAAELADEFAENLQVPGNLEECAMLVQQLQETNEYIFLEKERVNKSIEDMQRIRDNFVNRCIQTCSNIKTELDRLPKLSTITLDDEVISIIGLQIPYVKEEQYRERMTAYIDETVTAAESFDGNADRLQYIRNRLAWKRLFAVIVTDMNAVRVNLYKRERIKTQSRYLRYEEAVGSTGQSQGIYIQFLIAIINYISNINSTAREASVIGKTIFIDNPFGAAKDIYIWEPIFKLLKTNHVQLIVPARGATPAITGRFEVNYILGQKMAGQRQQTVVVDYHSQVEETELEYTRLDYEQQTLELL